MTVYLVCFDRPVGDPSGRHGYARHYAGTCLPRRLAARMHEEERGHGSRLMAAAARAGIGFELVRTWPGSYAEERKVKGRAKGSRELREKCPRCNYMPRISRWAGGRCRRLRYGKEAAMPARKGYSEIARLITDKDSSARITRQQVFMWAQRRSLNQRGQPFPAGPPFAQDAVLAWWAGGRPTMAAAARRSAIAHPRRRDPVTGKWLPGLGEIAA